MKTNFPKVKLTIASVAMVLVVSFSAKAQVTIGSDEKPVTGSLLQLKNTTEITGDNVNATKGLSFPRVNLSQKDKLYPMFLQEDGTTPTADYTGTTDIETKNKEHTGLVVYNMYVSAPSVTDPNLIFQKGLHVWTGTGWKNIDEGGGGSSTIEPWLISGTTDKATNNMDNIYQTGQVTIGSNMPPDPTAILNVVANNKGVLLPKVTLVSPTDIVTIPNPTTGLLVYNTGADQTFPMEGYMFWDGMEWRLISTFTSVAPTATFVCGEAKLDPDQVLRTGVPISGGTILKIPYTVGNGGIYKGAALVSTDPMSDIRATISNGVFENGSGYLAFHVSGTPTANQITPTGITFDLQPFYDANPSIDPDRLGCTTVTVGTEVKADIITVATMDNLKLSTDNNVKGYATQITTPDGRFSVRAFIVDDDWDSYSDNFGTDGISGINLQIRNNTNEDIVIAGTFDYHWRGSAGTSQNKLVLIPGKWSGDQNWSPDLAQANNLYYASYLDGTRTTDVASSPNTDRNLASLGGRFVSWGNPGVYALGTPERRDYSWMINDGAITKVAYLLQFTATTLTPATTADVDSCPNGICSGTKVYMEIEQITAP